MNRYTPTPQFPKHMSPPADHVSVYDSDLDDDEHDLHANPQCHCVLISNSIIFKPWRLFLRNILIRKEARHKYPNGLDRLMDRIIFQTTNDFRQNGDAEEETNFPISVNLSTTQPAFEEIELFTKKDKVKLIAYLIKACSSGKGHTWCQRACDNNANDGPPTTLFYTKAPTIIYFHGNSGDIDDCLDVVVHFRSNPDMAACNYLLVEYRGYGKSQGTPSEIGVYRDAKAAFDYLESREDIDGKRIILYGHSLGGAVAIHLASHKEYRNKVAGLIVENTFTSIHYFIKSYNPIFGFLYPLCCYSSRFESNHKIHKVKCPTLFNVGQLDKFIPPRMTEQLFKKCKAQVKIMHKFTDKGHTDTQMAEGFLPKIGVFIWKHVINNPKKESKSFKKRNLSVSVSAVPAMKNVEIQPNSLLGQATQDKKRDNISGNQSNSSMPTWKRVFTSELALPTRAYMLST